jgi:hypothetical protein
MIHINLILSHYLNYLLIDTSFFLLLDLDNDSSNKTLYISVWLVSICSGFQFLRNYHFFMKRGLSTTVSIYINYKKSEVVCTMV